jgi:hypothetical protein
LDARRFPSRAEAGAVQAEGFGVNRKERRDLARRRVVRRSPEGQRVTGEQLSAARSRFARSIPEILAKQEAEAATRSAEELGLVIPKKELIVP